MTEDEIIQWISRYNANPNQSIYIRRGSLTLLEILNVFEADLKMKRVLDSMRN